MESKKLCLFSKKEKKRIKDFKESFVIPDRKILGLHQRI